MRKFHSHTREFDREFYFTYRARQGVRTSLSFVSALCWRAYDKNAHIEWEGLQGPEVIIITYVRRVARMRTHNMWAGLLQDEHRGVSEVLFKHHSTRLPPSFGMGVQTIHCRLGGARDSILRGRRREAVACRLERRRRGGVEHLSRRVAAAQLPMSTLLERVQTATNAGPRAGSASENLRSETSRSAM